MTDKETTDALIAALEVQKEALQQRADVLSKIAEDADDLEGTYKEAIECIYSAIAALKELT